MQVYDLIMLVVLVGATLIGFRKGLAWQVASVASIFVSYIVAVQFRDRLAPQIPYGEPWSKFLSMLLLYLGTSLVIWILFRMVSGFIDRAKLKEFDHQLGALFGAAKGALLCIIITLFAVTLLSDQQRQTVIYSHSGYYIAKLLHRSHAVIPAEIHDLLDPYLHQLDERFTPEELEELHSEEQGGWANLTESPSAASDADRSGSGRQREGDGWSFEWPAVPTTQPTTQPATQPAVRPDRVQREASAPWDSQTLAPAGGDLSRPLRATPLPRTAPADDPFTGEPYPRRANVEPSDWRS